jgi:hypothetical protein
MSDDKYPGFPIGIRDSRDEAKERKDERRAEREDPKHLAFVRKQRCVIAGRVGTHTGRMHRCLRGMDAHHEPTIGKRTDWSDRKVVAMCREAHEERHRIGKARFERRYNVNLEAEAARLDLMNAEGSAIAKGEPA